MDKIFSDIEKGYLAGFIDGEGCIVITKHKRSTCRVPQHTLRIQIANTSEEVIAWIYKRTGGSISKVKSQKSHYRQCYTVCIGAINAYKLLKCLVNILIVKKQQALWAIKFWEGRKVNMGTFISTEEFSFREDCRIQISRLNKGKIVHEKI